MSFLWPLVVFLWLLSLSLIIELSPWELSLSIIVLSKNTGVCKNEMSNHCVPYWLLHYRVFSTALRSTLRFPQFTVSPAWMNDSSTTSQWIPQFDTLTCSYVLNVLETHEWHSQVTDLCTIINSSWMQFSPIIVNDIWELSHMFSSIVVLV